MKNNSCYRISDVSRETSTYGFTMQVRVHGAFGTMHVRLFIPSGQTGWERRVFISPAWRTGDTLFYDDAPWGIVQEYIRFAYDMARRMNKAPRRGHWYQIEQNLY